MSGAGPGPAGRRGPARRRGRASAPCDAGRQHDEARLPSKVRAGCQNLSSRRARLLLSTSVPLDAGLRVACARSGSRALLQGLSDSQSLLCWSEHLLLPLRVPPTTFIITSRCGIGQHWQWEHELGLDLQGSLSFSFMFKKFSFRGWSLAI